MADVPGAKNRRGDAESGGDATRDDDRSSEQERPRQGSGMKRSRKGKWTVEEEDFANKLIHFFQQGLLRLPEGTTLRAYIAERLGCDPMRITKKFTGNSRIGKKIFKSCDDAQDLNQRISTAEMELQVLEARFHSRVNVYRKTRSKHGASKAAAERSGGGVSGEYLAMAPGHRRESANLDDNHALNEAIDDLISSASWSCMPPGSGDAHTAVTGVSHELASGNREGGLNASDGSFNEEFMNPYRRASPATACQSNSETLQNPQRMGGLDYSDALAGPGLACGSLHGSLHGLPTPGARYDTDTYRGSTGGESLGFMTRLSESSLVSGGGLNTTHARESLGSDGLGHDFESAWDSRHTPRESDDIVHSFTNYLVACSGHYPRTKSELEENQPQSSVSFDKQQAADVEEASKRASWT